MLIYTRSLYRQTLKRNSRASRNDTKAAIMIEIPLELALSGAAQSKIFSLDADDDDLFVEK